MSPHSSDDSFHEIQLNGKQLVFLFMAATVVSVVIFLCGVLVGRGVRAERGSGAEAAAVESVPAPDEPAPSSTTGTVAAVPTAGSDPRNAAPPTPADELSYFNRLEREQNAAETLKPAASPAAAAVAAAPAAVPPATAAAPAAKPTATPPAAAVAGAPSGAGYAVQIAALNDRREADAMARRLSSKGYAAYVLAPAGGPPTVYRVRVGTFKTRREADQMAARLQKEEKFSPWVTR